MGGETREETIEAKASRLAMELEFKQEKRVLFSSEKGVRLANEEAEKLFEKIQRYYDSIISATKSIKLEAERARNQFAIYGYSHTLYISWSQHYGNTLKDSELSISLWEGFLDVGKRRFFHFRDEEPSKISSRIFTFDIDPMQKGFWCERGRCYSSDEICKLGFDLFFNRVSKIEQQ